jgi:hypothetical protein
MEISFHWGPVSASQAERRFVICEPKLGEVGLALSADWVRPARPAILILLPPSNQFGFCCVFVSVPAVSVIQFVNRP